MMDPSIPRSKWAEYREYAAGDFVLITDRHLNPKYYRALGVIRGYHAASGVYTVYVEKFQKELALHKTEMTFAHDYTMVFDPC